MDYENESISKGRIVNSLFWKLLERVSSQGINLVVQILLARFLMPEDFGSLALILAIVNFATIFVQSGLSTALIQKESIDELDVSTTLVGSLLCAVIFYCILFLCSPFVESYYGIKDLSSALRILSLSLFFNAINSVQTALLSRKMQFKIIFLRSIIAVPVSGFIGIVMALNGYGVWALVVHNLLNSIIIVVVMTFGTGMRIGVRFSLSRAVRIYSFSGKILLANLVSGFYDTLRTMVIGRSYSSEDLAYYDKAYTYSYYVNQIANGVLTGVFLPVFSREQKNIAGLKMMARKVVGATAFLMIPLYIGVATVSKPFVEIFLTEKWLPCVPFLMIFCVLRIPGVIVSIDKQIFYALGKSGIGLVYEIVLLIINIATILVTIRWGIIAIAFGALLVEWIGGVAICLISKKEIGYSLLERGLDICKPVINSLIMAVCVSGMSHIHIENELMKLFCQVIGGVLIYFLLAWMSKDSNLFYIRDVFKGIMDRKKRGRSGKI